MRAINELNRHIEPIKPEIEEPLARVVDSGWYVLGSGQLLRPIGAGFARCSVCIKIAVAFTKLWVNGGDSFWYAGRWR